MARYGSPYTLSIHSYYSEQVFTRKRDSIVLQGVYLAWLEGLVTHFAHRIVDGRRL
jgi:hypothetical protein